MLSSRTHILFATRCLHGNTTDTTRGHRIDQLDPLRCLYRSFFCIWRLNQIDQPGKGIFGLQRPPYSALLGQTGFGVFAGIVSYPGVLGTKRRFGIVPIPTYYILTIGLDIDRHWSYMLESGCTSGISARIDRWSLFLSSHGTMVCHVLSLIHI